MPEMDPVISPTAEMAELILAISRYLQPGNDADFDMCTPVESVVMRFVDRNPGCTARQAADATRLPASNCSRILKALEAKGLIDRQADAADARRVRLYRTEKAKKNFQHLQDKWTALLDGIIDDPDAIDGMNKALQEIEERLRERAAKR